MSSHTQSKTGTSKVEPLGFLGVVVRMFWLMVGNLALFMVAVFLFHGKGFSGLDIVFWAIVAALALVRYIDITRLNGLTSNSEPATLKHWHAYALKLLLISAGMWGLAHGVPFLTNR
jgi:hypothetical protein